MSKNGQVNNHSVHVSITFRNTEATDALRTYAEDKLSSCIKKFSHQDNVEVHTVLSVEKNRHVAEVSFHLDGSDFKASEESDNLCASVDKLIDSVGHQLRKHKERITAHH